MRRAPPRGGAADGGAGLSGDGDAFPAAGGVLVSARMISTSSPLASGARRRQPAVDLHAHRGIADIGVDGIGEVDRGRPARQGDQPALGREAEHLVVEQLQPRMLQKLFGAVALGEQVDGALEPLIGAALVRQHRLRGAAVLVERMRGDAVAGDVVHFAGAHLQFDALALRPDHRGVDGAVVVLFRRGNVVLEAAGHHRPLGVDHADHRIAVLHAADHDAKAENVGQLLEGDGLALHLRQTE